LKRDPVGPQLEVLLSPDRVPSCQTLLDIDQVRVNDLLSEGERAVEDPPDLLELLEQVSVRRSDRVVVLGRSGRVFRGEGGEGARGRGGRKAGRPQCGVAEGQHPLTEGTSVSEERERSNFNFLLDSSD
jgi:hypothetical protein